MEQILISYWNTSLIPSNGSRKLDGHVGLILFFCLMPSVFFEEELFYLRRRLGGKRCKELSALFIPTASRSLRMLSYALLPLGAGGVHTGVQHPLLPLWASLYFKILQNLLVENYGSSRCRGLLEHQADWNSTVIQALSRNFNVTVKANLWLINLLCNFN